MPTLGEMLEERRRSKSDAREYINELKESNDSMRSDLERVRKMIVNADVIDEAGKGIGQLLDVLKQEHGDMVGKLDKTLTALLDEQGKADKMMRQLHKEKQDALDKLEAQTDELDKYAKALGVKAKSDIKSAISNLEKKASENSIEAIKNMNSRFDDLQRNVLALNETMMTMLGVMQAPKKLEFDSEGKPIGVRLDA